MEGKKVWMSCCHEGIDEWMAVIIEFKDKRRAGRMIDGLMNM